MPGNKNTIQRVFAIVPPEFLENFQKQWNEMLNSDKRNKIKRLLDCLSIKGIINNNGYNGDTDSNRKENSPETG